MSEDKLARLQERDRAMRKARDEVLRRVAQWLTERGFTRAGAGHFTMAGMDAQHSLLRLLSAGTLFAVACASWFAADQLCGLFWCGLHDPYVRVQKAIHVLWILSFVTLAASIRILFAWRIWKVALATAVLVMIFIVARVAERVILLRYTEDELSGEFVGQQPAKPISKNPNSD